MIIKSARKDLAIDLVKQNYRIGGKEFRLYRVRNLDNLVDQVDDLTFNEDERLPYWAELWPSAIALAHYLADHPERIKGKTVLELGCGLGLTSMLIASQQPKRLVVSDYEQDALALTVKNFILNGLPVPETKLVDWRQPDLKLSYDVIIAADVLYEERFFQPLISLFKSYLNNNGGIILAEPNRPIAGKFFSTLGKSGFAFGKEWLSVFQDGQEIKVDIYYIKRSS